jgi:hypothetical protein
MHRVPRAVHRSRNVRHTGAQSRRSATGPRAAPPPRSKDECPLRRVSVPMLSVSLRGPLGRWMYDHLDSAIILFTRHEFKPNLLRATASPERSVRRPSGRAEFAMAAIAPSSRARRRSPRPWESPRTRCHRGDRRRNTRAPVMMSDLGLRLARAHTESTRWKSLTSDPNNLHASSNRERQVANLPHRAHP